MSILFLCYLLLIHFLKKEQCKYLPFPVSEEYIEQFPMIFPKITSRRYKPATESELPTNKLKLPSNFNWKKTFENGVKWYSIAISITYKYRLFTKRPSDYAYAYDDINKNLVRKKEDLSNYQEFLPKKEENDYDSE